MGIFGHRPEPHEVFTPGKPPLGEHNVYVSRSGAEADLKKYVQRGQVPVVWGEYGVGKSTLVQKYFEPQEAAGKLLYVPSVSGVSLPDIFKAILEYLEYGVVIESTVSDTVGADGGFDLKVVKASAKGESTTAHTTQLVVTSPTDLGMIKVVRDAGLTVVLDEMHKASPELRESIVDWIKATRAGAGAFTLVLVGTSTDAGRLVSLDHGIDRYVKEMSVELMTDDEARYIVVEGFKRLKLEIPQDLTERLIRSAAGAPTIVQALCLDAAEATIEADRSTVTESDVRAAVTAYLKEHGGRLLDHYYKAIETTGPRRYRKQVLQAVAVAPNDYATMEDIKGAVSRFLGEDVPATALSGPLRQLKTDEFGKILKDVEREVSGNRVHNLTTFTDPMMKSFVRFMNNLDNTGLMPEAPEVVVDGEGA